MKELHHYRPDQTTLANQRQVEKKKHIDTLVPYPGQKLWELNKATGEINQVELITSAADFDTGKVHHTAPVREGCKYVLAINKKNASTKFFKAMARE